MSYFDELVAKYKNMQYGELSSRNPSAVDNILQTQQGLLGNSLQFGNQKFIENIPTSEQEFINTPTGKVAQNRFRMGPDGNPIFGVPGQLNEDGSVGGGAAYYDSSIDYGEPGSAGVLPVDPTTGLISTQTTQRQGGDGGRDRMGPGVSTEFVGNAGFRINEDGTVTQLNPTSLDYQFNSFMNKALDYTPMGLLRDTLDPATTYDQMKRIQDKYGIETAKEFRDKAFGTDTPTKEVAEGEYTGPTGRETQADKEKRQERERVAAEAKAKEDKGGGYSGGNPGGGKQGSTGGGQGQSGPASGGYGGSSFCFAPDTLIQMADGSEKEIQNIKLGDDTKGGKVELVVQTLGHDVYNYKGVEVSGSHWVVEDGKYIEVETSKHAQPIDDKEMLYCLNTSDHAIWVKDIQFSDFIGFGLDYSVPGVHKFWESIKNKHTESIN